MNTRILIAAVATSLVSSFAFAQMGGYGGGYSQPQQPAQSSTGGQEKSTTTTTKTKTVMPQGVKGYLDQQLATSKDKKFHVSLNGKDLALTPTKIPEQGKATGKATVPVEMKGADGKTYEIDFTTSNGQVTGARIGKVNGKSPSSQ
jgi:hypothetical protein